MNPFGNLLHNLATAFDADDENRTPEEIEADEKRARIQWHRDHVRNGPAKFKTATTGQVRRAQARETKRKMKKARRKQVLNYFAQERFIATLRGNLQAAGVLDYVTDYKPSERQEARALNWLARTFEGDDLEARLKDAVQTYVKLTKFTPEER